MNELNAAWQTASAQMYSQAGPQGNPNAGQQSSQSDAGNANGGEGVQDADFEEVH
jgi:molecular chaperone DnaK